MDLISVSLASKHGLKCEGLARYYELAVGERLFDLEHTSPHRFTIGDQTFNYSSWSELLANVVLYLFDVFPEKISESKDFRTDWSVASYFFNEKRTNSLEIMPGVFLNINHTALHSCWLLYDLLKWFGIPYSTCSLLVHRMPKAEPDEVRKEITKNFLEKFTEFLKWKKLINPSNIPTILKNLNYLENKYIQLRGTKSGYNSLFLFDDQIMFSTAKSKFLSDLKTKDFCGKTNQLALAKKYLDYLTEFYGTIV